VNRAFIELSFDGVDSGAAFFSKIDLPPKPTTNATSGASTSVIAYATTRTVTVPNATGCPYPVVKAFDDFVAGHFLNGSDFTEAAVLTIMPFEDKEDLSSGAVEMQRVMQE
jgi:hypothetical protein